MAEPVRLPVPDAKPNTPPDGEKASAEAAGTPSSKLGSYVLLKLRQYASRTDEFIFRLEKLLSTTAGLETLLSPLNYALYLVVFLQSRAPSRLRLLDLLDRLTSRTLHKASPSGAGTAARNQPSTAAALCDFVTGCRNTLRLTALLPLYTLLRSLLSQPRSSTSDPLIHSILLLQCTSYILYQVLENLAHLVDLSIITIRSIPIPLYRTEGTTAKIWRHSSFFWVLGISFDLLRLAREAVLERRGQKVNSVGKRAIVRSVEEQAQVDRRWWNELVFAGCWWPLCLHWSLENGLSGVNDGVIGILGALAGWEALKDRWAQTKLSSR